MFEACNTPGSRKYLGRLMAVMAVYLVMVALSVYWLKRNPTAPWRYIIAVLPVLPAMAVPMGAVRCFREMDELQRKIQLEGLAFGFTAAAILTLSYGFLQNAGLPDLNWIWVWPVMGVCLAIGLALARRRYR
jgi:O-antigen/teichoic acid export membrane protein